MKESAKESATINVGDGSVAPENTTTAAPELGVEGAQVNTSDKNPGDSSPDFLGEEMCDGAKFEEPPHGKNGTVGPPADNIVKPVDNVVKRGPFKRSRMEGKHATPTHILLRNAGIKGICNEGSSGFKHLPNTVTFQAGNFGATTPRLFKDTQVHMEDGGHNSQEMELVPETQLVFDPGQTKFNPAFMQA
ncbi:hypothetical protein RIF29_39907 [Crotalaria pallida]|uniref:Uncharacterized protein n=1 Tax=Crotalaria pallida TaxID=3830 RepID=A0AAN9E2N8_CROPI